MHGSDQLPVRLDTTGPDVSWFRPLRALRVLVGSVLVFAGVLLLVPVLVYIILTGIVIASNSDVEAIDAAGALIIGGSTVAAIVLWMAGVKLIRGKARTVLFLRKFGFADAKDFISHAAARGLGRRWRLVTLDDLETAPVGSSRMVRWTLQVGRLAAVALLVFLLWQLLKFSTDGFDTIVGDAADRAMEEADNPIEGIFSAFAVALVVGLAVGVGLALFSIFVALVGALTVFASVSNRSLRRAESNRWTPVRGSGELSSFIKRTEQQRKRLFAPRIAVVKVVDELWKDTVRRLADISDAVLIDVSDPTQSLLWEVRMLAERPDIELVATGSASRLNAMATGADEVDRQLFSLLAGRSVLVYESDRRAFSKALRRSLEATG